MNYPQVMTTIVFIGLAFMIWVVAVNAAEPVQPDGYALVDCGGAVDGMSGSPLVCCRVVREEAT